MYGRWIMYEMVGQYVEILQAGLEDVRVNARGGGTGGPGVKPSNGHRPVQKKLRLWITGLHTPYHATAIKSITRLQRCIATVLRLKVRGRYGRFLIRLYRHL